MAWRRTGENVSANTADGDSMSVQLRCIPVKYLNVDFLQRLMLG